MKAKELIDFLSRYPDFEVRAMATVYDDSRWGLTLDTYEVTPGDIGHSDKVINLSLELL